jgi:aminopeptidase-like protein
VGDDRAYSFLPTRLGNTLADRVALHVLNYHAPGYKSYSFLERGSDERQYCSPLVDLPVVSIMRSKYASYPEYHTSLDNLNLMCPAGLHGAFQVIQECLFVLEHNVRWRATIPCEPQLSKRGLYPTISYKGSAAGVQETMNVLAYADGQHDLIALGDRIGLSAVRCHEIASKLAASGLLEVVG